MKALKSLRIPMTGLVLLVVMVMMSPEARAVPSFARQTGLKCSTCHSNPPELTAFGRKFKLEGYTLTRKTDGIDDKDLKLSGAFPLSAMLLLSGTGLATPVTGAQKTNAEFPQALSVFLAGAISSHLGGMIAHPCNDQEDLA